MWSLDLPQHRHISYEPIPVAIHVEVAPGVWLINEALALKTRQRAQMPVRRGPNHPDERMAAIADDCAAVVFPPLSM